MTTTNNTKTRTTGNKTTTAKSRRPRITKREKRILEARRDHEERRVSDADFFRDQRLLQAATAYFTLEEVFELVRDGKLPRPSEWGTRFFTAEFLPVLTLAVRRRDAALKPLIEQLERIVPGIVTEYDPMLTRNEVKVIMRRLRERFDRYSGPPESEPFIAWAMEQVANTLKPLRILRKVEAENNVAFADVYERGYRSAFAGVWEILRHCKHLGATPDTARQLVQDTFTKIFLKAEDWRDDGTASIPTRVRAYAEAQAMGWRSARISARQQERRMRGAMRRYGLPVKTRRRRAAE